MQDLLFDQLWTEPQADQYCPFTMFNASMGYVDDEFLPSFGQDSVSQSLFLNLEHSNSSFDSLESAVSPVDGLLVHDNLFGEVDDEFFFDDHVSDVSSPREEVESPVSPATQHHFGHYQQSLEMHIQEEQAFDVDDEIQEDSEEEKEVAPVAVKRTTKRAPTVTTAATRKPKSPRSPDAKIAKKPRAAGGRKKRAAVATPVADHDHVHDANVQTSCCLSGCGNAVTNRLRFSLRRNYTFKNEFLDRNWNKVCQYHYFSDLYQHKKSANMH
jgi:hypothetical protein